LTSSPPPGRPQVRFALFRHTAAGLGPRGYGRFCGWPGERRTSPTRGHADRICSTAWGVLPICCL
jgi:hypothetical protein